MPQRTAYASATLRPAEQLRLGGCEAKALSSRLMLLEESWQRYHIALTHRVCLREE